MSEKKMTPGMLRFEEELKKFYPSLEVEQIEDNIHNKNLTDMVDLMEEMVKETKERHQERNVDEM